MVLFPVPPSVAEYHRDNVVGRCGGMGRNRGWETQGLSSDRREISMLGGGMEHGTPNRDPSWESFETMCLGSSTQEGESAHPVVKYTRWEGLERIPRPRGWKFWAEKTTRFHPNRCPAQ